MANDKNQMKKTQNTDSVKDRNEKDNRREKSGQKKVGNGFDAGAFLELVSRYKRYIAAGILFIAMVLVLVKCTGSQEVQTEPVTEEQTEQADLTEEFQVDAIPEINTLISNYFQAYQEGDVDAIETYAQPVSDTEKSYIQLFSEYVQSYDNLHCYTKSGLGDGEYVVSVYLEMKFEGVDTVAPGLDFFYVRTDENGAFYIDNAYSQFNQSNMENSTQADIQALINEFEQEDDVIELQQEVQEKYDTAIASDEKLQTMANETIPNAITAWVESLSQADESESSDSDDTKADTATGDAVEADDSTDDTSKEKDDTSNEKDDTKSDDSKDTDTVKQNKNGKAKTAYALDGINLRKGRGTNTKIVAQISLGDKLKIYPSTKKNGWVKAVYKKKKGYVKMEYITTDRSDIKGSADTDTTDTVATALAVGEKITLTDSVNVRVSMSETADRVGLAYAGDTIEVIMSYAEGWTKVKWNGQTGYIKTDLIK